MRLILLLVLLASCHKTTSPFGLIKSDSLAAIDAWCGERQTPSDKGDLVEIRCPSKAHPADHVIVTYDAKKELDSFFLSAPAERFDPLLHTALWPSLSDAQQHALEALLAFVHTTDATRPFPKQEGSTSLPGKQSKTGNAVLDATVIKAPSDLEFRLTLHPHDGTPLTPATESAIDAFFEAWCKRHDGQIKDAAPTTSGPPQDEACKDGYGGDIGSRTLRQDGGLAHFHIETLNVSEFQECIARVISPLIAAGYFRNGSVNSAVSPDALHALAQGSDDLDTSITDGFDLTRWAGRPTIWGITVENGETAAR